MLMLRVIILRFLLIENFICAATASSHENSSVTTQFGLEDHCIGILKFFQLFYEKRIMNIIATSNSKKDYSNRIVEWFKNMISFSNPYFDGVQTRRFKLQLIAHNSSNLIFKITIPMINEFIILKRGMQSDSHIFNEIEILKEMSNYDNPVKIFHTDSTNVKNIKLYKNVVQGNRRISWIFMEELKFNFLDYLIDLQNNDKVIDTRLLRKMLHDVLSGLSECHNKNIVHGDIKPGNIMGREKLKDLNNPPNFVLIDFGLSIQLDKNEIEREGLEFCVGTNGYKPPEIMGEDKKLGTASDIWSLGITVFKCVYVNKTRDPNDIINLFFYKEQRFITDEIDKLTCSNEIKKFIESCLIINPNERPTADELLNNSFLKPANK